MKKLVILLGVAGAESPVPEARTAEYYKKRPCPELCAQAAGILEDYLREQGVLPAESEGEQA